MGYHLNSIYSISPNDKHKFFVFMLGGSYGLVNSTQEWLDKNFSSIASALGPNGAIVRGLSSVFETETLAAYRDEIKTRVIDFRLNERAIDDILGKLQGRYRIRIETPILIVTDRNPNTPSGDIDKQIFFFLPVGGLSEIQLQELMRTILACIRLSTFVELDHWITKNFGNMPLNTFKVLNEFVELKPGIAGISVNLNAIIDHFIEGEK